MMGGTHRIRGLASILGGVFLVVSSLAAAQNASPGGVGGPDREWRFIEKLRADGMLDVAATQLQSFAREYPSDPRAASAWLEAGRIHEELGQTDAAREDYESLLEAHPSSDPAPEAALRRAEILNDSKQYEAAAQAYRSLLEAYPASTQVDAARLGLGEALMARGDDGAARSMLRLLVAGRADAELSARARYDLGVLAERAESDSVAVERFDSVASLYPDQPIAGFALLRSAKLLEQRDETALARARYRRILELDTAPVLRGRARMGLARLSTESDPAAAMEQYERLAQEGASADQVQEALLNLASLALEQSDRERARKAAESYLESFPDADPARARLLLAKADLGEREDAVSRLAALAAGENRPVAHEAARAMGEFFESDGRPRDAMTAYRSAESAAAGDDERARAQLDQARMARMLGEMALAADLAERAAQTSASSDLRARALLLAARSLDAAGRRSLAIETAESLVRQLPLTAAATEARGLLRSLQRLASFDPAAAARELARLAARPFEDPAARHLEIGTLLRERLGDPQAALESFDEAKRLATTVDLRARAALESARTLRGRALEVGLRGESDEARELLRRARAAAADAAADAAAPELAMGARIELIGMDLADVAIDDAPWLFDADRTPLLGGVGAVEGFPVDSPRLQPTRQRIEDALQALQGVSSPDQKAWLTWRQVELSSSPVEERQNRLETMLQERLPLERELQLRYTLGQLKLDAGDPIGAVAQWSRIVDRQPTSDLAVAARYGLAEAHRAQKNYSVAADLYLDFANAHPQSVRGQRALLLAGDCALLMGEADVAVERYRRLLERYPDTAYEDDALYRLGTALQRDGKLSAARDALRRVLEIAGGSDYLGRTWAKLAQVESAAGNDSLSVVAWRELQDVDPARASSEQAALEIARIQIRRGRFEEALSALPDSARSVEALGLRVRALAGRDRIEDAMKEWEALRVAAVEDAHLVRELRCEIGDAQARAGRDEEASASYDFVIEEARDAALRARAHYQRGVLAARSGDFDRAREELRAATSERPTSTWTADALFQLGSLQVREGQPDLAQKSFARLATEFPDHPKAAEALSAEALAWRRMSRYDEALERYHHLLELYPEYPDAPRVLSNIAYCHHELHQYEVAVQAYRRVMPYLDEEGQAYAEFWIADSLAGLERYEEAAAAFLRIPYLYPQQGQLPVTAQLKAAEVYERMGKNDAATTIYQKVLRTHGANSQWGSEAQRRLDRLTGEQHGES